jgi:hypothetical protein
MDQNLSSSKIKSFYVQRNRKLTDTTYGHHGFSNIHRKDKIHTIQPEELPNSKQTNNQHMGKRRADRASETTPHLRIDLEFKNDLE